MLLGLVYMWAVPVFESPDESTHMAVVDYVADTNQLPVQRPGETTRWGQQGSQPPLYYLLASCLARLVDRSDRDNLWRVNPHAIIGNASVGGNHNAFLHDSPYPPRLYGASLAVFLVRLFSLSLAVVTLTAVWKSAQLLFPGHPSVPLLAAALVAFNPQFLFISISVNNDNLVTALNSLAIWLALLTMRDGFITWRSLLLAVLVALTTISKLSGWVIAPTVALAGWCTLYRTRDWRGFGLLVLFGVISWLVLASWWYARNWALYGEFFGTQRMLDIFGRRPAQPLLDLIQNEFEGLRISFWGLFGWFNVSTWPPFYRIMDIVSLVAAIGFVVYLYRQRRNQPQMAMIAVLLLSLGVGAASLIAWTQQTAATQGRLLFPFITAISIVLAAGLAALRVPLIAATPLMAFAALVPFITIIPAYAPPLTLPALPESATPLHVRYGDIELVGYETQRQRYAPGDRVPVVLYWRPLAQSDQDFSMFIRLLDPQDNLIAVVPTYPGYGRLRTTAWQPGVIYRDAYYIRLPDTLTGQYPLRAYVGWWKYPDGYSLDPTTLGGQPIGPVMLEAGALAAPNTAPLVVETLVEPVDFGGVIELIGYTLEGDSVTLLWQAKKVPPEDYTVMLVALRDDYQVGGQNEIVAQGDAVPALPTSYWRPGERYFTHHSLSADAVPGSYPLYVSWYSTVTPYRLPTTGPDNAYPLALWVVSSK